MEIDFRRILSPSRIMAYVRSPSYLWTLLTVSAGWWATLFSVTPFLRKLVTCKQSVSPNNYYITEKCVLLLLKAKFSVVHNMFIIETYIRNRSFKRCSRIFIRKFRSMSFPLKPMYLSVNRFFVRRRRN
jgi:hypothetical protein